MGSQVRVLYRAPNLTSPEVRFFTRHSFLTHMQRYRSGHNGADSKFLEAPAVSSAENVRRTGLCAGSDFTISYRSCVFFLHSSGARITLEIYGELSERSKVRHSKCRVPKRNLGFESLTLRQKPSHIKAFAHMTGLFSQDHIGVHDFRQELRCASRFALCPAGSGYCPLHLPR